MIENKKEGEEEWYDDQDILRMFKISPSTLYRLRKKNEIPFSKVGGKYIYPKTLIHKILLDKVFKKNID
ncbi:helix-turn-helix domain-containing protein [Flavobacterium sp. SUN046]|uniref:helix-turn-helix domain-containing protein n=1 Tax=Flavobacterium sp. SUN046 TaxID=3002440 RepID=UPI002DBA097E|nr:helix-turn-helix domain-containing protein [Flavobacterium sp. SUN046]MEC4048618.1 helix-turn-helix domain-containing protein [Flavobacterium sp. SUN046]